MKRTKRYLVLCVLIGILSAWAMARTELRLPEEIQPWLIGRPHSELSQIDSLHVTIVFSGAKTNKQDPLWKDLAAKVENKLQNAGIEISKTIGAGPEFRIPQLRIHIEILKLEDSQQYIFLVRTSLSRKTYLELTNQGTPDVQLKLILRTEVWKKASPMQVATSQDTLAKITEKVLQQTDTFAMAWTAANTQGKQASNTNDITTTRKEPTRPTVEVAPTEHKYVASKNSNIFHKAECSSAKRIAAKNLVYYKSRDEAINAGKRPCKICKP